MTQKKGLSLKLNRRRLFNDVIKRPPTNCNDIAYGQTESSEQMINLRQHSITHNETGKVTSHNNDMKTTQEDLISVACRQQAHILDQ